MLGDLPASVEESLTLGDALFFSLAERSVSEVVLGSVVVLALAGIGARVGIGTGFFSSVIASGASISGKKDPNSLPVSDSLSV